MKRYDLTVGHRDEAVVVSMQEHAFGKFVMYQDCMELESTLEKVMTAEYCKASLKQRIEDMSYAVLCCEEHSEWIEAMRSVLEIKWQYIPYDVAEKGIDAMVDYLFEKGVK